MMLLNISLIELILNWSEVWALAIPLVVMFLKPRQPAFLKPVIIYTITAFFLNLFGNIIDVAWRRFPDWFNTNTLIYEVHSLFRFACFAYFFFQLKQPFFVSIKKTLPFIFIAFIFINFYFFEEFNYQGRISGNILTAESYILLIYCMLYYLSQLKRDVDVLSTTKHFWVVTGLSIYVVINFFVFLFYNPLFDEDKSLARMIWNVHNVAYIILSIFIAKAFYVPVRH